MRWLPFIPQSASRGSGLVDTIFTLELAACAAILLLVFALLFVFCLRYRRGSPAIRDGKSEKSWVWEIGWTSGTLVAFLALFVWGAHAYIWLYRPPASDLEIHIVGRQWMWKMQHPGGQREIDALHVPLGKTIRLVLASEDVIHSFFVPAFRLKRDVVPGTYETAWFEPTKPGEFLIECSEFCGTEHAHMLGKVVVMTPSAYERWLADQGSDGSLAEQGAALFRRYGCSGCHSHVSTVHAPALAGIFGSIVHLQDGSTVRADERYLRDAILEPATQIVAGYAPIMPSFSGQIGEDDLIKLVSYLKSLAREQDIR